MLAHTAENRALAIPGPGTPVALNTVRAFPATQTAWFAAGLGNGSVSIRGFKTGIWTTGSGQKLTGRWRTVGVMRP